MKTINWYEKKGKGSYNDPKLNHFLPNNFHFSEIADKNIITLEDIIDITKHKVPEEQNRAKGIWIPIPNEVLREIKCHMEFTEDDLKPLMEIITKAEAEKIWKEIIERKNEECLPKNFELNKS